MEQETVLLLLRDCANEISRVAKCNDFQEIDESISRVENLIVKRLAKGKDTH